MTARELIDRIHARGGRTFRMVEPPNVFMLTDDGKLSVGLQRIGGVLFNEYRRARGGTLEYDVWLNRIEVEGEQTIWEAAAR